MNDEEFFLESGSEPLRKVHQWARARYVSPWAVLFGVLLRVAASVPPNVQLPPVIGGRASLNLLCAFVGKSGAGKGNSAKVAALAWPADIATRPLGSGQGIAEVFTRRPESDAIQPVIFDVPEVDTLSGLTKTQGSVLLPTVKSLAMGEQLGQTNATKESSRNVPAHSYRACLSVGVQPGHADVLFGDTTGGTPQRFLWVPVTDPNIVDGDFSDPAPLVMELPGWTSGVDGVVEIKYDWPAIEPAIRTAYIARNRGEADALDGHALLTRCKVAALLAIMHQRVGVAEEDWNMSGEIMAVSDRTRALLLQQESDIRAAALRERGKNDALRSEGRDDYQLESVKNSIVAALTKRDGSASASDLKSALGKPHRRKFFAEALAELVDAGRVVTTSVAGGTRLRLTESVQGEQPVQGALLPVRWGEQRVQDERSATVISIETHKLQKADGSKLSCQQWFDGHVAELSAKGQNTVEGAAVREAGEAAGYKKNQLYVAANSRGYKGTHWTLTG